MVRKLQRMVQHSRLVTEGAVTSPSPEKAKARSSDRNLEKGAVWREPPAEAEVLSKGALPTLWPHRERGAGERSALTIPYPPVHLLPVPPTGQTQVEAKEPEHLLLWSMQTTP